ncbi:MAG: hypothetical protein AB8E15_01195 [Bdellovibrionales bacterium]
MTTFLVSMSAPVQASDLEQSIKREKLISLCNPEIKTVLQSWDGKKLSTEKYRTSKLGKRYPNKLFRGISENSLKLKIEEVNGAFFKREDPTAFNGDQASWNVKDTTDEYDFKILYSNKGFRCETREILDRTAFIYKEPHFDSNNDLISMQYCATTTNLDLDQKIAKENQCYIFKKDLCDSSWVADGAQIFGPRDIPKSWLAKSEGILKNNGFSTTTSSKVVLNRARNDLIMNCIFLQTKPPEPLNSPAEKNSTSGGSRGQR